MNVGLFIPCYINQFYPYVGIATLELLEKQGVHVVYPQNQTCCGQPLANAGFEQDAIKTYHLFVDNFKYCDYIVAPSASCIYHVRNHYDILQQNGDVQKVRERVYEICEFLVKVLHREDVGAVYPLKVGIHHGCHGLRGLGLGHSSELPGNASSVAMSLLKKVQDIQIMELDKEDECCGFGGTFAVTEEALSVKMGIDRINDHSRNNVDIITSTDMSCLMHLDGIIRKNKMPVKVKHIVEILNTTNTTK